MFPTSPDPVSSVESSLTSPEPLSRIPDRLSWEETVGHMDWRPGEHVTLIGPTGAGKTELTIELLRYRKWAIFLSTKRIDNTLAPLREMGFRKISKAVDLNPQVSSRYIIAPSWPRKLDHAELDKRHRDLFSEALTRSFWQTGWTVAIDELEYINRDLRIQAPVDKLLRQGRSQGNSMILGTQRPRHVTLHAYEQATHLFLWRQSDMSNITRASELAGIDRREIAAIIPTLDRHDVLYVNTITGERWITNTRS